jgi:hypothetical protein
MEKKENVVTFATVSKIEEILLNTDELKGKINKSEKIDVPKRGSPNPVKVLKLAAEVTKKVENAYAPRKDEVVKLALELLAEGGPVVAQSVPDSEDDAPSAPSVVKSSGSTAKSSGVPTGTIEHSEISKRIAADLELDLALVESVTGAFVSHVSGSFVLGLVALSNSLHFIASSHDKMPGHEARVKAIDDIRRQYVEAGTLTSRKSRS